jgi:VanZ family protein
MVSGILGTFLLALYVVIFNFSGQDGEKSGNMSRLISEKCVEIWGALTVRNWSDETIGSISRYFENPVRKLGHFAEYTCMGMLVFPLLSQWLEVGRKQYFLTALWVFISAGIDEFHQLFVPGRYGSLADVLLDTCGGVFGIFVYLFIAKCIHFFFSCNR